jgi:hypothetical protein
MPRNVFISFHYQRDIFRVNVLRNHLVSNGGYLFPWETAKITDEDVLKRMLDQALKPTSVTVVLIGAETANRRWVQYEIRKSLEQGSGILGIYIHNIPDLRTGKSDKQGTNPLDCFVVPQKTQCANSSPVQLPLSSVYSTYDWVGDDGYNHFGKWIELAAQQAGKR